MHQIAFLPEWLSPESIIDSAGPWALLVVCLIVFSETGLLVGFLLPGDTLLVIAGLLTHTNDVFHVNIWIVALAIAGAAFIGGEVGYYIGHKGGPAIFERKESGLFSRANVERTNAFFERFGGITVVLARFVPIVRTFTPVAAGVGHMPWKRYSLYNFIGAMIWGFGLTMFGYLIAYIPWVADFVKSYIDLILIGVVAASILVTGWHYLAERRKVHRALATGGDPDTDALEAAELRIEAPVFDRAPDLHGDGRH